MKKERIIEILNGIDCQCGAECPISREECAKCDYCLMDKALMEAIKILEKDNTIE